MSVKTKPLRTRARLGLFTLAVVVPAMLLGAGWITASLRDGRARVAMEELRLRNVLGATERAIAEGLDELRRREEERPFYLYSHYYVPPDLLTLGDVVAVSPLAERSRDPRIIGWFQIDPDGTVRTPLSPEPLPDATGLEGRLRTIALAEALEPMRARIATRREGTLVTRTMTRVENRAEPVPPRVRTIRVPVVADEPQVVASNAAEPLPVLMNQQANQLAFVIQQAQSSNATSIPTQQSVSNHVPRQAQNAREAVVEPPRVRRIVVPPPPVPEAQRVPTIPAEIEVTYSPMSWVATDDAFVLARIVSHEGTAVLQGVALDRDEVERWMRDVAGRAALDRDRAKVVTRAHACAMTRTSAHLPPGVVLCIEPSVVARVHAAQDRALRNDLTLLAVLLGLVVIALLAVARLARKEAELAAARSDFVTAVSHELRTPITTLRMHAEMLTEGLVSDERQPRVYDELAREALRLSRLVENVLEVSRLEAGRRILSKEDVCINDELARVVKELEPAAHARGMTLTLVAPAVLRAPLDRDAFERILVNVIDNAIKYSAGREPNVVRVSLTRGASTAVITVQDYGLGIPVAERERVFERFHRVKRDEDAHRPGTGLGLSLVRELVLAHGGHVAIEGADGVGTSVRITLPLS